MHGNPVLLPNLANLYMKTSTIYENSPTLEDFNGEKLHTKLHLYKSGLVSKQAELFTAVDIILVGNASHVLNECE